MDQIRKKSCVRHIVVRMVWENTVRILRVFSEKIKFRRHLEIALFPYILVVQGGETSA